LAEFERIIVQRGHSREPVFFEDDDYSAYLIWLKQGTERYQCAIHAYVLMTNHIHLLATPAGKDGVMRMMQYVGRYYVPYINHTYGKGWGRLFAVCETHYCSSPNKGFSISS
jgi:putative transposase